MKYSLLFLCLATVHVLGETQQNVPLNNNSNSSNILLQHNTEQTMDLVKPVPLSLDATKNKAQPEENLNVTIPSSTTSAPHSAITSTESTTVLSHTDEPPIKQIQTAIINPPSTISVAQTTASSVAPGKWIVNGTDKICLIVQMSVEFNISYTNGNESSFKVFDLPTSNKTTNASGSCGSSEQNLTLTWSSVNMTNNGSMTLHFMKNENKSSYSLHHLEIILPLADFTNASANMSQKNMTLVYNTPSFEVGLSNSYRCFKQQTLNLQEKGVNGTAGYLMISDLQFQAFRTDNYTVFGLAKNCVFDTPDVVPIAVGCALAALVIIVLIAYLIGRRRSQTRDYLSM